MPEARDSGAGEPGGGEIRPQDNGIGTEGEPSGGPSEARGRPRSLKRRILLWTAAVAMGPLVIMAAQGYHCAREAIIDSERAHLISVVESRRAQIQARLDEWRANLRVLSTILESEYALGGERAVDSTTFRDEVEGILTAAEGRSPSWAAVAVYDPNWNCLSAAGGKTCESFDAPREFGERLGSIPRGAFGPTRIEAGGTVRVYAGEGVSDSAGNRLGFVVADLELSPMVRTVLEDRTGLGGSGKVYLVAADGRFVAPPANTAGLAGGPSRVRPELLGAGAPPVLEYRDHAGRAVLGAAAPLPAVDWWVVAEIEQEEAFAWLGRLQTRALVTGSVTLLLVLLVSGRSATRLSDPLRQLARVSRRIARGHHNERVGEFEVTEAREVGRAFNAMLDELAASHRRLVHSRALAAVGELSSRIVHEMRNPLSSVKMNLQALRRKVEGDGAHAELADIALGQVARLERMASDLLGYGKPLDLKPTRIRLGDAAGDVIRTLEEESSTKGVTVTIAADASEAELTADPEQLRRALTNLLSNAIQASPRGGRVEIEAGAAPGQADRIDISFRDEGPGFGEGIRESLFQPFFTTRPGGTGLGLANVKKIAEYHGGTVFAENLREGGAAFTIRLPREGPSG